MANGAIDLKKFTRAPRAVADPRGGLYDFTRPSTMPGASASRPINEMHPDLAMGTRALIKNTDPTSAAGLRHLRAQGFEAEDLGGYNYALRKPGGKWHQLEREGFELADVLDLPGDILSGVAGGAGALAGSAAGPAGTIGGGAAGMAAASAVKSGIGRALGLDTTLAEAAEGALIEGATGAAFEVGAKAIGAGLRGLRGKPKPTTKALPYESWAKGAPDEPRVTVSDAGPPIDPVRPRPGSSSPVGDGMAPTAPATRPTGLRPRTEPAGLPAPRPGLPEPRPGLPAPGGLSPAQVAANDAAEATAVAGVKALPEPGALSQVPTSDVLDRFFYSRDEIEGLPGGLHEAMVRKTVNVANPQDRLDVTFSKRHGDTSKMKIGELQERAEELGLQVVGTGKSGKVTKKDLVAAITKEVPDHPQRTMSSIKRPLAVTHDEMDALADPQLRELAKQLGVDTAGLDSRETLLDALKSVPEPVLGGGSFDPEPHGLARVFEQETDRPVNDLWRNFPMNQVDTIQIGRRRLDLAKRHPETGKLIDGFPHVPGARDASSTYERTFDRKRSADAVAKAKGEVKVETAKADLRAAASKVSRAETGTKAIVEKSKSRKSRKKLGPTKKPKNMHRGRGESREDGFIFVAGAAAAASKFAKRFGWKPGKWFSKAAKASMGSGEKVKDAAKFAAIAAERVRERVKDGLKSSAPPKLVKSMQRLGKLKVGSTAWRTAAVSLAANQDFRKWMQGRAREELEEE